MHNIRFTINVTELLKANQASSMEEPSFLVSLDGFRLEAILEGIPPDLTEEFNRVQRELYNAMDQVNHLRNERDNAVNRANIAETRYKDLLAKHPPSTQELEEIVKGMNRDNKINAIKAVRENSLMSLIEAKNYVEGVWAKNPIPTPAPAPPVTPQFANAICMAKSLDKGCFCSLAEGHNGDHIAYLYFGHDLIKKELLAQWPNPQEVKTADNENDKLMVSMDT